MGSKRPDDPTVPARLRGSVFVNPVVGEQPDPLNSHQNHERNEHSSGAVAISSQVSLEGDHHQKNQSCYADHSHDSPPRLGQIWPRFTKDGDPRDYGEPQEQIA
jgi:uncharacterized protein YkwD